MRLPRHSNQSERIKILLNYDLKCGKNTHGRSNLFLYLLSGFLMLKNEHYRKPENMMHSAPMVKPAGSRKNQPWSNRCYCICGAKAFRSINLPICVYLITSVSVNKTCKIGVKKSIVLKNLHGF